MSTKKWKTGIVSLVFGFTRLGSGRAGVVLVAMVHTLLHLSNQQLSTIPELFV